MNKIPVTNFHNMNSTRYPGIRKIAARIVEKRQFNNYLHQVIAIYSQRQIPYYINRPLGQFYH